MMFRRFIGAGMIAAAAALGLTATAESDPPNCTAGDLSAVMSGVNAGMAAYLLTHPDVNAFFTSLKGMTRDQMRDAIVAYGQSHPQVQNEIQAIRQPATDFRNRCQAPVPDDMPGG